MSLGQRMPGRNGADSAERIIAIARDLRAYAQSGMEPAFAAKLVAAAEEIERRIAAATAGEVAS
jgi:hypothetical protein